MIELKNAPCILEALARRGYGIAWHPRYEKFWPLKVDADGKMSFVLRPQEADKDFGTVVRRLGHNVKEWESKHGHARRAGNSVAALPSG